MKQSSTYQEIVEEGVEIGIEKGRAAAKQDDLILLGTKRFDQPPDAEVAARIRAITDPDRLDTILLRILDARDWNDLLAESE
jgi:hypothetical protein